MRPKTLSASAAQTFENCDAMFNAEYILRGRDMSSEAADLGSTCHSAMELWVKRGLHKPKAPWDEMVKIFAEAFDKNGLTDTRRYDEGLEMCRVWWERTDLDDGREVLSTEKFERFNLTLPDGFVIPWVYVMDRLDRHADGEIEIVDYKTVMMPIQPEELTHRVQGRAYAVAAQIMFPEAEKIRVTFDLLRHEQVSVVFTKEQNRESYKYLQRLGERVLKSDGKNETLNENCRYCVRRHECGTLKKHIAVDGPLSITDPMLAADRAFELKQAQGVIKKMIEDLDAIVLGYCEDNETLEFATPNVKVKVGASRRREIDPGRAATVIGADLVAKYGNLTIGAVEELLKGTELTDDQKSSLKQLITTNIGNPSIKLSAIKKAK